MSVKTLSPNRPNFLGSEVGLVLKTITVTESNSFVTESGRKIVKAGTIFTSPYYGLLFEDADVTDGPVEGNLMIGGRYIDANLPTSASSQATNFANQGLYAIVEGTVTRPDFGSSDSLTALTMGTVSVSTATLSFSKVTNAVGYGIYKSATQNGTYSLVTNIAQADSPTYKATAIGYYKVKALGDNISYSSSALSNAVQVTSLT